MKHSQLKWERSHFRLESCRLKQQISCFKQERSWFKLKRLHFKQERSRFRSKSCRLKQQISCLKQERSRLKQEQPSLKQEQWYLKPERSPLVYPMTRPEINFGLTELNPLKRVEDF